jgi:hypothetical protein
LKCNWEFSYKAYQCKYNLPIEKDGYCILHSPDPRKDIAAFNKALEELVKDSSSAELNLVGVCFPKNFVNFQLIATHNNFINLEKALFNGEVDFESAIFANGISFDEAEFFATAKFSNSYFKKVCSFYSSHFHDKAEFKQAKIEATKVNFKKVTFDNDADFGDTLFKPEVGFINFNEAVFKGPVSFGREQKVSSLIPRFLGNLSFYRAIFEDGAYFSYTHFSYDVNFSEARFSTRKNAAVFEYSVFDKTITFCKCLFSCSVSFKKSKFISFANFGLAIFEENADFKNTVFEGGANFSNSLFKKDSKFSNSSFGSQNVFCLMQAFFRKEGLLLSKAKNIYPHVNFSNANIGGELNFNNTTIYLPILFNQAVIEKACFQGTKLHNLTSFREATFGQGGISFDSYKATTEVPTIFEMGCSFFRTVFKGIATFRKVAFSSSQQPSMVNFEESIFEGVVDIYKTDFLKGVSFVNASFLGSTRFILVEFPDPSSGYFVNFKGTSFKSPKLVNFADISFKSAKLIEGDPTLYGVNLIGVEWGKKGRLLKRSCIYEEKYDSPLKQDLHAICCVYQKLKVNLTVAGNYSMAGDFHIGEMETRTKLAIRNGNIFDYIALTIYRISSRFGERWLRSIIVFFTLLVLMAISLMLSVNFDTYGGQSYQYGLALTLNAKEIKNFTADLFFESLPRVFNIILFLRTEELENTLDKAKGHKYAFSKHIEYRSAKWKIYHSFIVRIFAVIQLYFMVISFRRYFHR